MVDERSSRFLRWALGVSGALGLLSAVSVFLFTLIAYVPSPIAARIYNTLPPWTSPEGATPPGAIVMLIVGGLCALLLVVGRWPIKVLAALAVVWFVYAHSAYGPNSRWTAELQQAFDLTPFRVGGLVGVVVLLALSILAVVIAAHPTPLANSSVIGALPPARD